MGVLYRARHIRLDTAVALKVIRNVVEPGSTAELRFEREVRALTRMRSAHVVRVLDAFTLDDGRPCLVSEFLPGDDAHVVLGRKGPLAPLQALDLGIALAAGLASAHRAGLVHRDVKPGNLMIAGNDFAAATLIDFGVARIDSADPLTREGTILGTPAYMAPEQLRDPRLSSPAADVYSAGAVLYHALAGQAPYPTHPPTRSVSEVLAGSPPHLLSRAPEVPFRLAMLVDRAMSRDPRDRPQDGDALLSALREVRSSLAPAQRPGPLKAALSAGLLTTGALTLALGFAQLLAPDLLPPPLPSAWLLGGAAAGLSLFRERTRARKLAALSGATSLRAQRVAEAVEAATLRAE